MLGGRKANEHSALQGACFGEHHMKRALGELYLPLHDVERSEAQSVTKMQSFYGQQRMSDYYQQSGYIKFFPFQAWIKKSQSELQYVYQQARNRTFGSKDDLIGTQHGKMGSGETTVLSHNSQHQQNKGSYV